MNADAAIVEKLCKIAIIIELEDTLRRHEPPRDGTFYQVLLTSLDYNFIPSCMRPRLGRLLAPVIFTLRDTLRRHYRDSDEAERVYLLLSSKLFDIIDRLTVRARIHEVFTPAAS